MQSYSGTRKMVEKCCGNCNLFNIYEDAPGSYDKWCDYMVDGYLKDGNEDDEPINTCEHWEVRQCRGQDASSQ